MQNSFQIYNTRYIIVYSKKKKKMEQENLGIVGIKENPIISLLFPNRLHTNFNSSSPMIREKFLRNDYDRENVQKRTYG